MNRDECDRIIVESNAKMQKVLDWYFANKEWLDKEEFRAPIESGCIVLQEEGIDVTFEDKGGGVVEMAVYATKIREPVLTFDYRPAGQKIGNYRFPTTLKPERRALLQMTLQIDRTDWKESIKYHALMLFAAYYQDIVVVDEKKNRLRTRHEAKKLRRKTGQPLQLVKKTYVLTDFEVKELRKHGEKRAYTIPDHEVAVRGYYRTSKTGKRVWVRPFSRYKDKGNKRNKDYKI